MRLNYIITAYSQPDLLERTIHKLQHQNAWFYIHVDLRVNIEPFKSRLSSCSHVKFLEKEERIKVEWGDISMVIAELNLIKKVLKDTEEGYIILMSGQDYPIKSSQYIHDYFEAHYPTEFVHAESVETVSPRIKKIMKRHASWHWVTVSNKFKIVILPYRCIWFSGLGMFKIGMLKYLFDTKLIALCIKLFFTRKQIPQGLRLYAAETWWEITTQTAKNLVSILNEQPEILKYYSTFGLPEESMIQSLIFSNLGILQGKVGDILVWINRQRVTPSGQLLSNYIDLTWKDKEAVIEKVKSNDYLFARKLSAIETELLDVIDSNNK